MNQAQSSQLGLPQAGTTGQRRGFPSPGPAGSPGLSAQGLNLALLDELAAPQLLDLPVQVADFRHGPPPRRGSEPGPPPPPHRTGVSWERRRRGQISVRRECRGGGQLHSGAGSPPPPHLTSSHSPDRLLKTPVESRGTALKDGGQEASLTITAAATLARAFGVPAVLFPSALVRRHRRFHFRPRRGSKGRPVPPHDGCGVIHTLPLPRRTLNPTSGA